MSGALMNRSLPKWPQMRVVGKRISQEMAWEVIRRTDSFFEYRGGNDREWNTLTEDRLKMPVIDYALEGAELHEAIKREDEWQKAWGLIRTEYVHNSWLSSAFVGGPHGWCHPDGSIHYRDNVGKWPSVEDVLRDWQAIAEVFHVLVLDAVLYSGESCEANNQPIVRINVDCGLATLHDVEDLGLVETWVDGGQSPEREMYDCVFMSPRLREHHPDAEKMIERWIAQGHVESGRRSASRCGWMRTPP